MLAASDMTEVVIALIGTGGIMGAAGLALLGRWLDRRLDEKAAKALVTNTSEHGETKEILTRIEGAVVNLDQRINDHITFHAHNPPSNRPNIYVVKEDDAVDHLS